MVVVFVILCFVVYLAFFFPVEPRVKKEEEKSPRYVAQMKKLWQVAQLAMKEHKPFRAEKALLTILKFDEKNAAAYNRLGILYAKEQKIDEAVECFEIAQSLDNNPASIHNVGLIYLETGEYEKAEMAFERAIELEGDVPTRYIALAKTREKLGQPKKAVEALESAYELDPKVSTLRQILAIYEMNEDIEAATATAARIEAQIARDNAAKVKRNVTTRRRQPMNHPRRQAVARTTERRAAPNHVQRRTTTAQNTNKTAAAQVQQAASRRRIVRKRI